MALELARGKWRLGLLDRSTEGLRTAERELLAAGAETRCYAGDVADEPFVAASVRDFAAHTGGLDFMVNNAGVAVAGPLEDTSAEDWRWIVDINLLGTVWGCRAAVPVMRAQRSGLVLNVASAAGFAGSPQMTPYNATKSAVIALSETMAAELAGTGIQVCVAMPGFFSTHLLDTMRAPPDTAATAHRLMQRSSHDAAAAARELLLAAAHGRLHIVWPREYRLAWRLKRLFPAWFVRQIGKQRGGELAQAHSPQG